MRAYKEGQDVESNLMKARESVVLVRESIFLCITVSSLYPLFNQTSGFSFVMILFILFS